MSEEHQHAVLSASSASRWLNCPPSAKLNAEIADEPSAFAMEGTDAHSLCDYKVKKLLGLDCKDPTEDLDYYNAEMEQCAEDYAQYIFEILSGIKQKCSDPVVLVEQRLDFSTYVPDGFGTGDCVLVSDDVLHIVDFKYGKGIPVSAERNPQMMCYALGALEMFAPLYDITTVYMHIFQPRLENVSVYPMSKEDLLSWAEDTLKPIAQLANSGEGDFKAGSHCRFCKVKATCRKRAEYNMELAKYDFQMPPTLDDCEISAILSKADDLSSWLDDVKEYALQQALNGVGYDGFKLVEGRSNRKYTDENAVIATVQANGYDPYEQKLLSVTAMQSMLGKKKFDQLLGSLVIKPQGKPTLVPITDKRAALNLAAEDFMEEK